MLAGDKLAGIGAYTSRQGYVYFLLLVAFVLLIASVCVPYYVDSTGSSSGVFGQGKDCLGFSGESCGTIHAFPILTIIMTGLTLASMTTNVSIPLLSNFGIPQMIRYNLSYVSGMFGLSVPILMLLTGLCAIITLATQLGMPLSGSSLSEQAKNQTNPTTFKEGMALSSAGVALIIFAVLIQMEAMKVVLSFF